MKCVNCQKETAKKVIYMGFPMKLCTDCHTLWGFWWFILILFPWSMDGEFAFMTYKGSYWLALWYWLRYGFDGLDES